MSVTPSARRGNSALEVIVMLATVLFILLIGVSALGWSMRDTLSSLSPFSSSDSVKVARGLDSSPSRRAPSFTEAQLAEETRNMWHWAGVGVCLALNLFLWLLLFRRLRKVSRHRTQTLDEAPRQVEHARTFEQRQQLVRFLTSDMQALFDGRLGIRHVMTTSFVAVPPSSRPSVVIERLRTEDARYAIVCDSQGRLLGVVTLADLQEVPAIHVESLMRRNVPVLPANTSIIQGLTVLLRCDLGCLPVVNDEKVIGLLTSTEAIVTLQSVLQFLEKIADRVKPVLREKRGLSITEVALSNEYASELVS